jgi:hypothetical protein
MYNLSRHLPEDTEENHAKLNTIVGVLVEILTRYYSNVSQKPCT